MHRYPGIVQRHSSRLSFNLTELLLVIAVLMILLSLFMPSINRAIENSSRLSCLASMRSGHMVVTIYAEDFNGYAEGVHPQGGGFWSMGRRSMSVPTLWGILLDYDYADAAVILGCPGKRRKEAYIEKHRPTSFGNLASYELDGNAFSAHYMLRYNGPRNDDYLLSLKRPNRFHDEGREKLSLLADDAAYGLRFPGQPVDDTQTIENPKVWAHDGGGNVLRHDGVGIFVKNFRWLNSSGRSFPASYMFDNNSGFPQLDKKVRDL